MQLLQAIAGYTLGNAYIVLKAISKKNKELMATEEPRFKEGCLKKGLTKEQADDAVESDSAVRRLLVQPLARHALWHLQLPDGLAEGALPDRVYGGGAVGIGRTDRGCRQERGRVRPAGRGGAAGRCQSQPDRLYDRAAAGWAAARVQQSPGRALRPRGGAECWRRAAGHGVQGA